MTRYEAHTLADFEETGITTVVIARTDDAGWTRAGVFLIDLKCLGVKDAFAQTRPATAWLEELERLVPAADRLALHPACARKLVEGAAAYAQQLGFLPAREYAAARRVFGPVRAEDCREEFTYGMNGKPLYVAGPNDDGARIARVLRTLAAKLGPDGFHYLVPVHPFDDATGDGRTTTGHRPAAASGRPPDGATRRILPARGPGPRVGSPGARLRLARRDRP